MKKYFFILFTILVPLCSFSQIVSLSPSSASASDEVTLTFDASQGNAELAGASKVYMHHGVVLDAADGTAWSNVVGNWGADDGIGEMTAVAGETDKWEITFAPTLREYFGVAAGTEIFRISGVFRSADGTVKGTIADGEYGWGTVSNGDYFINLNAGDYISLNSPSTMETYMEETDSLLISATASAEASAMKIWIDEGSGYVAVDSVASATLIEYYYKTSTNSEINIKITGTIGSEDLETTLAHNIYIIQPPITESLPEGYQKGVNYTSSTSAGFVLWAPEKEFVYLIGDFNDWTPSENYQMKKDGDYYWLDVTGLVAGTQYVYQYVIDGEIKIADPYTEQVSDPWNDGYISETTYPGLVAYPTGKTEGLASVAIPGQTEYTWEVTDFVAPPKEKLVIYECLVRDFTEDHTYKAVSEKLDYLESLGITALELMPINEFEGNESWGYNPSFYFAPDKYYGPKNELKSLIDECHKRGIAVLIDLVLNHSFSQSPFAQMYLDGGKPAANNPWYNRDHNMVDNTSAHWGYDFNHESIHTKELVDSINGHWLREYKVDGFRFDFTKGFTNTIYTGADNWASDYDASRIAILKRMADEIWKRNPNAYISFEHLSVNTEETELANYGIMLWGNMNYNYGENSMAWHETNKSDLSWGYYGTRGWDGPNLITYAESHDEERIMFKNISWGNESGDYSIKDTATALTRISASSAFLIPVPGPKMIWQFQELGYDYSIDYNGRVGNKPVRWDYFDDPARKDVYDKIAALNMIKVNYSEFYAPDTYTANVDNGAKKSIILSAADTNAVIIGNFDVVAQDVSVTFPSTGTYSDFFAEHTVEITSTDVTITLQPGEFRLYSNRDFGYSPNSIKNNAYSETVSIYPNPANSHITIKQEGISKVAIYTVTGQLIKEVNFDVSAKSSIDISELQGGLYIVKSTDNKNTTSTGRFLKIE